jgi:hypothetical protein
MGKFLIITGIVILAAGLIFQFGGKFPFLGKLPGDIRIEKENFTIYIPIASCLLISVLISLILAIINKVRH